MTKIAIAAFTKPWTEPIEQLADKIAGLGLDGIELPIRPGYQVQPDDVRLSLPKVVKVLKSRGLDIPSAAAPLEPSIIEACGEAGIPIVRSMVGVELKAAGYAETISRHRRLWDSLIPTLEAAKVTIGIQNHSGNNVGSAIGLFHLIERYDPRHVCAILDMAHSAIAGEPTELAVDLLWPRMKGLLNFKGAFRERINGPEEMEAEYRTHWTIAAHAAYSWRALVENVVQRGFKGTFCLPAEYSDPGGAPQRMGDSVLPYLRKDISYLKSLLTSQLSPGEPELIKDRKVRICLIGAGAMANKVHYPSLASLGDVEIVGVIESRRELLDSTCDKFGIPAAARFFVALDTDYQEILKRLRPDGVYVIGQPEIMYPIWQWCLTNQFNLYIEKPMGLTMHQAEVLTRLAESGQLVTQVSHQRRVAPIMVEMRNRLLEKGPITHGVVEFFKREMVPMVLARDRMLDDGTHAIDTARWICGGEVVKVESHCKRVGVADINWIGATLHFDNRSTCFVVCSWSSGRRVFRTQMHAPGGYADVELESEARLYLDGDYAGQVFRTQDVAGSDQNFVYGGFRNKTQEFIESLKSGVDSCSSPFRDVIKTMRVCHTVLAQALVDDPPELPVRPG